MWLSADIGITTNSISHCGWMLTNNLLGACSNAVVRRYVFSVREVLDDQRENQQGNDDRGQHDGSQKMLFNLRHVILKVNQVV